jgi:hypothetical protein
MPRMATPDKSGVMLRAVVFGGLPVRAIVRWADEAIIAEQKPPQWLIDLSVLDSERFAEMLYLLRQHVKETKSREVDVCILAHLFFNGQLSIEQLFQRVFEACICDYDTPKSEPFERLADVLVDWDTSDLPDPAQGNWRVRVSEALMECQRACGDLPKTVSGLYAE